MKTLTVLLSASLMSLNPGARVHATETAVPAVSTALSSGKPYTVRAVDLQYPLWSAAYRRHLAREGLQAQEKLALMKYLTEAYRAKPQLKPAEALQELGRARAKLGEVNAGGMYYQLPSRTEAEALGRALETLASVSGVPGAGGAGKLARMALEVGHARMSAELGPLYENTLRGQRIHQLQVLREAQDEILRDSYALGASNESARQVIDHAFGVDAGALVHDSPSAILDKNADLEDSLKIRELMKADGRLVVTQQQILQRAQATQAQINAILEAQRATTRELNQTRFEATSATAAMRAREAQLEYLRQNEALERLRIDAARSAVSIFSNVAALAGNSTLADGLRVIGGSAIDIAYAVQNFNRTLTNPMAASGEAALGAIVFSGNVLGAGMAIVGFLDSLERRNQPNPFQVLSDQIAELQRQVSQMRSEMHTRFDALDRQLGQMFDHMNESFTEVLSILAGHTRTLEELREWMARIDQNLLRMEREILRSIRDLYAADANRDKIACLGLQASTTEPMTPARFAQCLGSFTAYATENARLSLNAGAQLRDTVEAPYFINTLFGSLGIPTEEPLPNPDHWAAGASWTLTLLLQWPKISKKLLMGPGSHHAATLAEGQRLRDALERLRSPEGARLAVQLVSRYQETLEGAVAALAETERRWLRENAGDYTIDRPDGGSPDRRAFQSVSDFRPKHTVVYPCSGDTGVPNVGAGPALDGAHVVIQQVVPQVFQLAERFGIDEIKACYRDYRFTGYREEERTVSDDTSHTRSGGPGGDSTTHRTVVTEIKKHAQIAFYLDVWWDPVGKVASRYFESGDRIHVQTLKRTVGYRDGVRRLEKTEVTDDVYGIDTAFRKFWNQGPINAIDNLRGARDLLGDEVDAKIRRAMERIHVKMDRMREELNGLLTREVASSPRLAGTLEDLDAQRALLQAMIRLGLPRSAASNPFLNLQALPTRQELFNLLLEPRMTTAVMKARVVQPFPDFRAVLEDAYAQAQSGRVDESYPALDDLLEQLRLIPLLQKGKTLEVAATPEKCLGWSYYFSPTCWAGSEE